MSTQQDINAIRAQRFANTHDPLALITNTHTKHILSTSRSLNHSLPTYKHTTPNNNCPTTDINNELHEQKSTMQNPKDILVPTTALDMELELMSKAFQLNNITQQTITKEVHQTLARKLLIEASDIGYSDLTKAPVYDSSESALGWEWLKWGEENGDGDAGGVGGWGGWGNGVGGGMVAWCADGCDDSMGWVDEAPMFQNPIFSTK
ncbi:hypothetical protein Tco_0852111 [Tanacetum coccineum]